MGVIIRALYVKVGLHLQIRAFDRLPLLFAEPRPATPLGKRKEGNELTSSDGQCPVPRRSDARVGLTKQHDSSIAIFFYNAVRTNARAVIHDGVSAIYLRALYVGMTTLTCGDEQFCIRKAPAPEGYHIWSPWSMASRTHICRNVILCPIRQKCLNPAIIY